MDWPAYSPDLNPIEHAWDALWRSFAARLHHPENTQQIKQMLIDEWALLPQEMFHQLVLSMRRRCEATIARTLSLDRVYLLQLFCTMGLQKRNVSNLRFDNSSHEFEIRTTRIQQPFEKS
ncbi:transposable element Tcb2 transposase [Trichonephila clavipes]|nr:transposable element Tcb2 transposase [Trichonephila clavipes]